MSAASSGGRTSGGGFLSAALKPPKDRPQGEKTRTVINRLRPQLARYRLRDSQALQAVADGQWVRTAGIVTVTGIEIRARAVVLTVGTFLGGRIHVGLEQYSGGRAGDPPSLRLAASGGGRPQPRIGCRSQNTIAATPAAAGIVRTHAMPIDFATPQRTADNRLVAPTPMIADEMLCVVDTGMPK